MLTFVHQALNFCYLWLDVYAVMSIVSLYEIAFIELSYTFVIE